MCQCSLKSSCGSNSISKGRGELNSKSLNSHVISVCAFQLNHLFQMNCDLTSVVLVNYNFNYIPFIYINTWLVLVNQTNIFG